MKIKVTNISIGGNYAHIMDDAVRSLRADGYEIDLFCCNSSDMDDDVLTDNRMMGHVAESDITLIRVHGDVTYYKNFDRLRKVIEDRSLCAMLECNSDQQVTDDYRYMFRGQEEDYIRLLRYLTIGGRDNNRSALLWVLREYGGVDAELPDAVMPPAQGAYTGKGEFIDIGVAVSRLREDVPRICILFHQAFWLSDNVLAVDGLIGSVRKRGADAVAIFTNTFPDDVTGAIGLKKLIYDYLLRDGRPLVDCVIQTMGFSQTLKPQAGTGTQLCEDNFFEKLDVPVIQAISLYGSEGKWRDSVFGLNSSEIAGAVVSTEYDGQIISVPFAGYELDGDGVRRYHPISDRCDAVADIAFMWASLRNKGNESKKVAVLLYMYPPRNDLAGGASGLDTMESVANLIRMMSVKGYNVDWIPENGKELVERLLAGVTNDHDWISDGETLSRSVDIVSIKQYAEWFGGIAERCRDMLIEGWGEPPGDIHTVDGKILLPGIMNGNLFIGFQPDRGKTVGDGYHDPDNSPPHQYLAYYKWLRYVYGADAVVHMGTHGSLEWLPGKSVGLSRECFPDAIMCNLPDIYPYIIDNPGEGMQAKRRGYACVVTHMIPAMTRADIYDKIGELESAVQSYLRAKGTEQTKSMEIICGKISQLMKDLSMFSDLGLSEDASAEEIAEASDEIYDYILDIKDALITDGLHVLGKVPEGECMAGMIYSLVRYPNEGTPSLRNSIAKYMGFDMLELMKNPSGTSKDGRLNGEVADAADSAAMRHIRKCLDAGCDPVKCSAFVAEDFHGDDCGIADATDFICGILHPNINRMQDEMESILHALEGGFVPPGPAGCPTRGRAKILPTGRNFYSIDPDGIPWNSSWEIGRKMADGMIERYVSDKGEYPRNLGMVVWATDTMRTGGDDISYALWLMGLRPVWAEYGGRVKGLEVVPLGELGRPRVDVTLRVSGLFRDAFPNLIDIMDAGVATIASLDESDEDNSLLANLRKEVRAAIMEGIPEDTARREASFRIFSNAPGQYGCGVNSLITNGKWEKAEDLGEAYIKSGCYVYGKGVAGKAMPSHFKKRMGLLDATVKNHSNRECDLFDMDDDYDFLGGMNAAVKASGGARPESFMGDSSDMENLKTRTLEDECRFVFRSKINNPKWLDGLKRHGFRGAQDISQLFDYMIGWDGTSDVMEKWMYDSVTENFVLDEETRDWINEENPYAMMNMLERLNEAVARGLWEPEAGIMEKLKEIYLKTEERMEGINDR